MGVVSIESLGKGESDRVGYALFRLFSVLAIVGVGGVRKTGFVSLERSKVKVCGPTVAFRPIFVAHCGTFLSFSTYATLPH